MRTFGLETISHEVTSGGYFVKCIATASIAVFFPGSVQHRDVKQEGASYEDDYRGNAMAATITPGAIDIRFHKAFPDDSVRTIFQRLLKCEEMAWAAGFTVRYQGRVILES